MRVSDYTLYQNTSSSALFLVQVPSSSSIGVSASSMLALVHALLTYPPNIDRSPHLPSSAMETSLALWARNSSLTFERILMAAIRLLWSLLQPLSSFKSRHKASLLCIIITRWYEWKDSSQKLDLVRNLQLFQTAALQTYDHTICPESRSKMPRNMRSHTIKIFISIINEFTATQHIP